MNPLPVLKIAVVGHTNTGKTSLMRTLTRNSRFGDVADRPATTGHVEGASLLVDNNPLVVLYDTPGLEDSISLLEHLESRQRDRHTGWRELSEQFLDSLDAKAPDGRFAQEAKVIRQVLASDLVLYVADARDRMLGKHHDELEILSRFAKPVLPVLNFTASPEAKVGAWRESLAQARLHMVAEFDTVVFNANGEQQLFEKLQALLDPFHDTLAALIADRKRQRADLVSASAKSLADMLIDVAAHKVVVPAEGDKMAAIHAFKQTVRQREQQCVTELLEWHQFQANDYTGETLPIDDGHWGLDLFNPASLQQFGIRAGGGATAGAAGGLAIDAMLGGASLGAGAAVGAAIGALWTTAQTHGRRIADRARGFTELRASDTTLRLLAVRQIALIQALLRRGHASQDRIRMDAKAADIQKKWARLRLPKPLTRAKLHPDWSYLNGRHRRHRHQQPDVARLSAEDQLAKLIEGSLAS